MWWSLHVSLMIDLPRSYVSQMALAQNILVEIYRDLSTDTLQNARSASGPKSIATCLCRYLVKYHSQWCMFIYVYCDMIVTTFWVKPVWRILRPWAFEIQAPADPTVSSWELLQLDPQGEMTTMWRSIDENPPWKNRIVLEDKNWKNRDYWGMALSSIFL